MRKARRLLAAFFQHPVRIMLRKLLLKKGAIGEDRKIPSMDLLEESPAVEVASSACTPQAQEVKKAHPIGPAWRPELQILPVSHKL
jgi:hypothetical protein